MTPSIPTPDVSSNQVCPLADTTTSPLSPSVTPAPPPPVASAWLVHSDPLYFNTWFTCTLEIVTSVSPSIVVAPHLHLFHYKYQQDILS